MKVLLTMVSSLNGRSTRGAAADIHAWTSQEDKKIFAEIIKKAELIVMGSATYKAGKSYRVIYPHQRRIVLTKTPRRYATESVPGSIEFTNETPQRLTERLSKEGYKKMLLLGGSRTSRGFFDAQLVDELWLTVEPIMFGRGKPLIADGAWQATARLLSITKLNRNGTLLLRYKINAH